MRSEIGTSEGKVKFFITDEVIAANSGRPLLEIENNGASEFFRDDDVTPNGMTAAEFKYELGVR